MVGLVGEMMVENRVALVTGAAMGQGADAAKMLVGMGCAVGLLDINEEKLRAVSEEIVSEGGKAICLPADVSDRAAVQSAFEALESAFGPVWAAASAAAVLPSGGFAVDTTEQVWARVIGINLMGVVNVCTIAAQSMIANGTCGRIVNWSSVNAVVTGPGFASYAASKAALEMFSCSLAVELAPHGITVNCIRPGSIETPMMFDMDAEDRLREAKRIPLGRWGTPRDTSGALRFLLSADAEWVTGSVLTVDGGAIASAGNPTPDTIRGRIEKRKQ